jgi:hypothetical protein
MHLGAYMPLECSDSIRTPAEKKCAVKTPEVCKEIWVGAWSYILPLLLFTSHSGFSENQNL